LLQKKAIGFATEARDPEPPIKLSHQIKQLLFLRFDLNQEEPGFFFLFNGGRLEHETNTK
jgi:hypothetical protein